MYHYVRPISKSAYPSIKGLELDGFHRQLDFFQKHKKLVTTADVIDAVSNKRDLPKDSVWLTFDDGYKDHCEFVAPILIKKGIDAAFFPVSDSYQSLQILDVNKIHLILALVGSDENLIEILKLKMKSEGYVKIDFDHLWHSTDKFSRHDTEEVIFFKRMLQRDLPLDVRSRILNSIFEEIVGKTEREVAIELYMSESELVSLHNQGFTIGSHTASHQWLNSLNYDDQKTEIDKSLKALKRIVPNISQWIMCYPYGAYNEDTLDLLNLNNCALALTTKVGSANLLLQHKFELHRLDTNDFPQ